MIDQMQEELMRLRVESVQAGAVNYVYIFEDGTVRQSTCKPEEAELSAINDGVLQVLEIKGDVYDIGPSGERLFVPAVDLWGGGDLGRV